MVHKVLAIVARILFSLLALAFVVCLVYTLAAPAVRAGFDSAAAAIEGAVAQATEDMDTDWSIDLAGLFGSNSGSAEPAGGDSAGVGAASGDGTGASGASASSSLSAQERAYRTWEGSVGDPMGYVFGSTGVTAEMLEGVAGGSSSAGDVLVGLDETALSRVSANAASYAMTAAAAGISSSLPAGVRAQMSDAAAAAQEFAEAVQSLVAAVRQVQAGTLGASGALAEAADGACGALRTVEACVADAEAQLGL